MKLLTCILVALAIVGVYSDKPEKLVNGIPASIQEYPHCASLRDDNDHFCGGSIIDSRYILTAGHCVENLLSNDSLSSVTVVTGTTYLNTGGQAHKVEQVWCHEDYDPSDPNGRSPHDIGLIKLATPIKFGPGERAIRLPTRDIKSDEKVTIAAWGSTGAGKPLHKNLQKLYAKAMLPDKCQSYHTIIFVDKTEFCTLITYGTGLCSGDSGSGLIRNSDNTIVGLVSGGIPCAEGYPDVYTNVHSHVPWIEQKMSL
ncbi:PREDICTED: chymotrypsin-1-like [Trachymyrmex cornetzi]|uniref:chymotrypsin-1-like n=1 Tax=Trachymyrmex cornetzi TaxID=471704 RepID=UPI00084EFB2E|nr:PREDICTED: chymotrypsin-1-like [Trachymyrmex cornetzi]